MRVAALVAILSSLAARPAAAQSPDGIVERDRRRAPKFKSVAAFIAADQDRFVRDLVKLTEIPAPPFKEQARAQAFLKTAAPRRV